MTSPDSDDSIFEPCGRKNFSKIKPAARAELRLYAEYLRLKRTEQLPPFDEWRVGREAPPDKHPMSATLADVNCIGREIDE